MLGNVTLNSDDDDTYGRNGHPFRKALDGAAPYWFCFGPNTDADGSDSSTDVVANEVSPINRGSPAPTYTNMHTCTQKGLIVRTYTAVLGGSKVTRPSISVFSGNRLELAVESGVDTLLAGDFIEATFEYIILPAAPQFSDAIENSDTSETLVEIESHQAF